MRTTDFNFELPPELIAQTPASKRDASRLLVLHRDSKKIEHRHFRDLLEYLRPGDVLILNNSRVIPARLRGVNAKSGGGFEMLLLEENSVNDWWAMIRPAKRARVGTKIILTTPSSLPRSETQDQAPPTSPNAGSTSPSPIGWERAGVRARAKGENSFDVRCFPSTSITATVLDINTEGHRRLQFTGTKNISDELDTVGEIPLPPYIQRTSVAPDSESARSDRERYQTVFADPAGSVAAPTAGLHFTESLLAEIRARGIEIHFVTLHVGLGTFLPVKAETLGEHTMHEEAYEVSEQTANAVNTAKKENRRVIAVGTTSVRVLESAAQFGVPSRPLRDETPSIVPGRARTKIFIYPPRNFQIVDALLTNFHLPRSTLLMLISAFAAPGEMNGRETILSAYAEAIRDRYRFFSYGDAMLIL
jgi:S-adenosylmethionine:tRNA ribosyltransferase-isomerase